MVSISSEQCLGVKILLICEHSLKALSGHVGPMVLRPRTRCPSARTPCRSCFQQSRECLSPQFPWAGALSYTKSFSTPLWARILGLPLLLLLFLFS